MDVTNASFSLHMSPNKGGLLLDEEFGLAADGDSFGFGSPQPTGRTANKVTFDLSDAIDSNIFSPPKQRPHTPKAERTPLRSVQPQSEVIRQTLTPGRFETLKEGIDDLERDGSEEADTFELPSDTPHSGPDTTNLILQGMLPSESTFSAMLQDDSTHPTSGLADDTHLDMADARNHNLTFNLNMSPIAESSPFPTPDARAAEPGPERTASTPLSLSKPAECIDNAPFSLSQISPEKSSPLPSAPSVTNTSSTGKRPLEEDVDAQAEDAKRKRAKPSPSSTAAEPGKRVSNATKSKPDAVTRKLAVPGPSVTSAASSSRTAKPPPSSSEPSTRKRSRAASVATKPDTRIAAGSRNTQQFSGGAPSNGQSRSSTVESSRPEQRPKPTKKTIEAPKPKKAVEVSKPVPWKSRSITSTDAAPVAGPAVDGEGTNIAMDVAEDGGVFKSVRDQQESETRSHDTEGEQPLNIEDDATKTFERQLNEEEPSAAPPLLLLDPSGGSSSLQPPITAGGRHASRKRSLTDQPTSSTSASHPKPPSSSTTASRPQGLRKASSSTSSQESRVRSRTVSYVAKTSSTAQKKRAATNLASSAPVAKTTFGSSMHPVPDFKTLHASLASKKPAVKLTVPKSPPRNLDSRIAQRNAFDAKVKEAEHQREQEREEERKKREEEEEKEIKEERKRRVVKAHGVPSWYKDAPKLAGGRRGGGKEDGKRDAAV